MTERIRAYDRAGVWARQPAIKTGGFRAEVKVVARFARDLVSVVCVLTATAASAQGTDSAKTPAPALAVGYTKHTFSSDAFSPVNVDQKATYRSGFQWYLSNFFADITPQSAVTMNADGSVSAQDIRAENYGGNLSSVGKIATPPYFVGTAFGCGAYIDGALAFDDSKVKAKTLLDWPAFWTDALEMFIPLPGSQWEGQAPGYLHWLEPDIFEKIASGPAYEATLHDWFGIQQKTCPNANDCEMATYAKNKIIEKGVDWGQWHHYGMLWSPATALRQGYIHFFFDGQIVDSASQSWSQFTSRQQPPAINAKEPWVTTYPDWAYGVIDMQHLVVLFGSGRSTPVKVKSVDVYQGPGACNLTN